jgi:hypothetical protein
MVPSVAFAAIELDLKCDRSIAAVSFAATEIQQAAASARSDAAVAVAIVVESGGALGEQAYRIERPAAGGIRVVGGDAIGAMYGSFDIAEAIRTSSLDKLAAGTHAPYLAQRGVKFNIPLDLRTPSYSDCSDAAQANIPVMWEREFWTAYLDALARHRYNVLSLWSLHPFPSMVRVPEFPDVALDDVWRTRVKLDDRFSGIGNDMLKPEMLADHEVVKKISMEEKIAFWRWIMQYAKDRGISIYVFTWNVFTWGAEGKHGITSSMDNPVTKAYFRASVRETLKTYPLLAGFGITAGEGMPQNMDTKTKERWLWETYGEGVRDYVKTDPARTVRMIHRFHWTAQGDILEAFKEYPGPFDFSFKYSVAHMYSITNPPFIQPLLENLAPGRKTWLTVRNDDIYSFRFGDPAYARDYIKNMPPADKLAGFYMGSDGYIPGRDFLDRQPPANGPRPLVIEKQWYSFMMWGRLAYDPTLPDALFERALAARFPEADAHKLFPALQNASQTMPLITRFFWGDIDQKWFPEACLSHPRRQGFYTVRHFMEGVSMPGSDVLDVRQWRAKVTARQPMNGITPIQIADSLQAAAGATSTALETLRGKNPADAELRKTLDDCEALGWLARYYSAKIRGACALALFDSTSDAKERDTAVRHLEDALTAWKRYAAVRDARYVPALYNRVGYVDITALTEKVAADIALAREWKPGSIRSSNAPGSETEKGFKL